MWSMHRRNILAGIAALFATPALAKAKGDPFIKGIECKQPLGIVMFSKKAMVAPAGQIIVTDQSVFLPNEGVSFFIMNVSDNPVTVHFNKHDAHPLESLEAADFLRAEGEWRRIKAL